MAWHFLRVITSFTQSGHIGAVPYCCGYFDEGVGKILVQQVSCSGPEENVTSCSYSNSTLNDHQYDMGVQCQQGYTYYYACELNIVNKLQLCVQLHSFR